MWSRSVALVLVISAALVGPSVARAAGVSNVNGTTSYSSLGGEKDNFVVTLESTTWHFAVQFGGASILGAGTPCSRDGNGFNAFCPVGSPGALVVQLNDNDDTASVIADGRVVSLSGGAGNDTLSGANARLNVSGGDGDDLLSGAGPNADVLVGDGGNDYFSGVAGPDTVDGGAGVDTASFAGQIAGIVVTLDDQANDGPATGGGTENVMSSVENVIGTTAGDTLSGSPSENRLEGGGGDDLLRGNAGADVLSGGPGNDVIEARDGAVDDIDCGPGNDTARVDVADTVASCETVILPDDDGDGVSPPADCNDGDPSIHPGAVDRPGDGIDQDCNGTDASTPGLVDRDGDRTSPPQDCDDGNVAIHPGATDRPGNRVDEDCSGADAAFPHVTSPIVNTWVAGKRVTRVMRLDVLSVPSGGRVEVRCNGRGCAFRTRTVKPRGARARLGSLFGGRGLRVGTVVEIRVLAPDQIGKVLRYTMRSSKLPRSATLCLSPAARTPSRC